MMRLPPWLGQHVTALRTLLLLTVVTGLAYPLAVTGVAQLPGLQHQADASLMQVDGRTVGSTLVGQAFMDKDGTPLEQYFQSRPSAAGAGYDPTATSASNLGPESVVDTLPRPGQGERPGGRRQQAQPADPGLHAQPGRRAARGRQRSAAVLHAERRRRGARGLPPSR